MGMHEAMDKGILSRWRNKGMSGDSQAQKSGTTSYGYHQSSDSVSHLGGSHVLKQILPWVLFCPLHKVPFG